MGVASGKFAAVNGMGSAKNWTLADTMATHAFRMSNTKGGTYRMKGIRDWNGSFVQVLGTPTVMPGEIFTFKGFTAPVDPEDETDSGPCKSGSAIVDSVAIAWDFKTGAPLLSTVNFSGNGPLTDSTDNVGDLTSVAPISSLDSKIVLGSGTVGMDYLTTATLTITALNQQHIASDTAGWVERVRGPIDWNMALAFEEADTTAVGISLGEYYQIKAYTGSTYYWDLLYGVPKDFSGIAADRDTGAIIAFTTVLEMSSHNDSGTEGGITIPNGGDTWWPIPTP